MKLTGGVAVVKGAGCGIGRAIAEAQALEGAKVALLSRTAAELAALMHRQRTGGGRQVEAPMFESMAPFLMIEHLGNRTFGPNEDVGDARVLWQLRKPHRTLDGYVCALPYQDCIAALEAATARRERLRRPHRGRPGDWSLDIRKYVAALVPQFVIVDGQPDVRRGACAADDEMQRQRRMVSGVRPRPRAPQTKQPPGNHVRIAQQSLGLFDRRLGQQSPRVRKRLADQGNGERGAGHDAGRANSLAVRNRVGSNPLPATFSDGPIGAKSVVISPANSWKTSPAMNG